MTAKAIETISEKTRLQIPFGVVVASVGLIFGGAAWLTTLQLGQASLLLSVQTMQIERKEDKKEFTDTLKSLQDTTQRTQLDVVEMKGDIKAIRRR